MIKKRTKTGLLLIRFVVDISVTLVLISSRAQLKFVEDEARKTRSAPVMKKFGDSDKSKKTVSSMISKKGDPMTVNSEGLDSPGGGSKGKKGKKKGGAATKENEAPPCNGVVSRNGESSPKTLSIQPPAFSFQPPVGGLNALRLSRQFCDVILCVDGQEFPTHRIILSSFSA